MKKELISELFQKFEQACYIYEDIECWSARELQTILGYSKWENFSKVIDKAKTACESGGVAVVHHFPDVGKMIDLREGNVRWRGQNLWCSDSPEGTEYDNEGHRPSQ